MDPGKKIFFLLKLILSLCLIAWIISKVNLGEITNIIASAKIHFLLIGILWLLLDRVLMSYRWNILLMAKNIRIPFPQIVKIYFVGTFSGNFLPSSIAPDAVRAYFASKYDSKTSDILSSVIVDRILGLFSLGVLAIFSLLFVYRERGEINLKSLSVILGIFFLIALLIFSERVFKIMPASKLRQYMTNAEGGFIWKNIVKIDNSCNEYKNYNRVIQRALFLSFVIHVLSILAVYVLSLSINLEVSLIHLFLFVPLINILIMLPISIGGIGVQEGAFIYFFSKIGISSHGALTVALLFRALTVVGSLPGGVFYVLEGTSKSCFPFRAGNKE